MSPRSRVCPWGIFFGGLLTFAGSFTQAYAQSTEFTFQGRVQVSGTNFSGAGQFKLTLIGGTGAQVFWGNSADLNNDGQPDTPVSVGVNGGLFVVTVGDTNLAGMAALPSSVFTNSGLHLRIWFNDGTHGMQQLSPDQLLTPVAYAVIASNVPDGAITPAKLAANTASTITSALSVQVASLSAQVTALAGQVNTVSNQVGSAIMPGVTAASVDPQDAALGAAGYQLFTTIAAPGWTTSGALDAPGASTGQGSAWTGQQLIVWGGNLGGGVDSGSGAGYRPDLDAWQGIPSLNAPAARNQHTAVWSGRELLVWGGAAAGNFVNTGGRYNPSNQVWTTVSITNAPAGRAGHVAAWTGGRMVIWGGRNSAGLLGDGGYYDPVADQWTALALPNAPSARYAATAEWAGDRVLIWGGADQSGGLNTGAQLLIGANGVPTSWVPMSTLNAPSGRSGHSSVWTGQKMLVWGGQGGGNFLSDGAAYDPVSNSWSPINITNAPAGRSAHGAAWSGQEMLVFGGEAISGALGDGAAYEPATGKWRPLSANGGPQARSGASVAWDGTELLVFGGEANGTPVASLQRLNPQPTWYLYRKP